MFWVLIMLHLHVQPAEGQPFERRIRRGPVVLGRAAHADLVLEDRFLSRRHARLFLDDGSWWVEDLGSLNGTRVDGERITAPTAVGPGSVITLSESVVTVEYVGEGDPGERERKPPAEAYAEPPTLMLSASDLLAAQELRDPASFGGEAEVRRQAERLKLLNEVHRALGRSLAQDELLELILDRVFAHLRPEVGALLLRRPDGTLERAAGRPRTATAPGLPAEDAWMRQVADEEMAVWVDDTRDDPHLRDPRNPGGARSLVAAPLLDDGRSLGALVLTAAPGRFSREDLELLVSLASVAALALRNTELVQEAAERRRLEGELALARRIQTALLPERPPQLPGWELHAGNLPSRGVSGDFYQVLPRAGGRECVLMVADVSGKGIAASLLTATLEALAAAPLEEGRPPEEVCGLLCRQLHRRTAPERYATLFLAVLEVGTGTLGWTCAGHNPPLLLRRGGERETLEATGPPLGLVETIDYPRRQTALGPGDLLVIYTDGIVEVADPQGELFGEARLEALCRRHHSAPLPRLAAALEEETEAFARGVPFEDDRTVVLLRRV